MDKLTPSQIAGLNHCRDAAQLLVMTRHYMNGTCPFCGEPAEGDNPWLPISSDHWHIKENRWPMAHTKTHLIIAPVEHITELSEVGNEAWTNFWVILARIRRNYGEINGGLVFRSGSLAYSAGTMEHLHANILYPDLAGPVRITLAKETGGPEHKRRDLRIWHFCSLLPEPEQRFLVNQGVLPALTGKDVLNPL